jgi:hypothetical protein
MRRSPVSGITGATKQQDKHDCIDAIEDNEESLGGLLTWS